MDSATRPFGPGCPWWDMRLTWGEPNVKWCEETICAVVNEPANAWSNVAYVVVAAALVLLAGRARGRMTWMFAGALAVTGLLSFAYHATNNYFTQLFDFIGMFVLLFLMVVVNARRLGWVRPERELPVYLALVVGATAAIPPLRAIGLPFQLLIVLSVLFLIGSELRLRARGAAVRYTPFITALGLIVVAAGFSAADVTRLWCDPTNHFVQGHVIWHLLSAVSLGFAARFYEQVGAAPAPERSVSLQGT